MTENNDNLPVKASFQNISSGLTPMAMVPNNFTEFNQLAHLIHKSGMAPKDMRAPETIFVAMMMGAEVGLAPMQALQNIAVINGRPSIWGDTQLALCRQSQLMEYCNETLEGEGDDLTAICKVKRKGDPGEVVNIFSVRDAKKAGLWGKQGPWTTYPSRMLKMRARGFSLRDAFPDVLKGLSYSREEAMDLHPVGSRDIHDSDSAGDKLNEMIGLNTTKAKDVIPAAAEDTIVVSPEKAKAAVIDEKENLNVSEEKEQLSSGEEESPESSSSDTEKDNEVANSNFPHHPFNRTQWIACRAASTLEKLVKDHAESWETTTPETKKEFHDKWKRILKAGAAEAWPFEDMDKPVQEDDTPDEDRSAEAYINIFKGCESIAKLEGWFKANSKDIFGHADSEEIVAEYDRLMDANQEPKPLVTAQDFINHIYHAEDTSALSMIGMKYAETVDALPEKDQIWSRIDERMAELNKFND